MKRTSFFLAATLALALPLRAQTIDAPQGWNAQTRTGGVQVFTPSDLAAGEIYSVTAYPVQSLDQKPLDEWMRGFAGTVGSKVGQLAQPLQTEIREERLVIGTGTYVGPNGARLGAVFMGLSLDGETVHVARTLFSGQLGLMARYQGANQKVMDALVARAKRGANQSNAPRPASLASVLKPGGALVVGTYAGEQFYDDELQRRFRVSLYPNGEYRLTVRDTENAASRRTKAVETSGTYSYNRQTGRLDIDRASGLANPGLWPDDFCFFGRNAAGRPIIYAEERLGARTARITLRFDEAPDNRLSPSAQRARDAAIEAEKKRYKFVVAPGKGIQNAQIAAILHHYDVQIYYVGASGSGTDIVDEAYLLLRDGSVRQGLPVAPDQMDVVKSRQKEPAVWGRWRLKGKDYQVSWAGKPFRTLAAYRVVPAAPRTRLNGRYSAARSSANMMGGSYANWGVTFSPNGRFKKDESGGSHNSVMMQNAGAPVFSSNYNNGESFTSVQGDNFTLGSGKKANPDGDREGIYSLDGYTLTLRYDNGQIARMPFFFSGAARGALWFEGNLLSLDKRK